MISLDKIAKDAIKEKKFVEVIDYVRPETENYDTGYTIRKGLIYLPLQYTGQMSGQKVVDNLTKPTTRPLLTPDGFTLTFTENSYRIG